jgi:hypothetical protein
MKLANRRQEINLYAQRRLSRSSSLTLRDSPSFADADSFSRAIYRTGINFYDLYVIYGRVKTASLKEGY